MWSSVVALSLPPQKQHIGFAAKNASRFAFLDPTVVLPPLDSFGVPKGIVNRPRHALATDSSEAPKPGASDRRAERSWVGPASNTRPRMNGLVLSNPVWVRTAHANNRNEN